MRGRRFVHLLAGSAAVAALLPWTAVSAAETQTYTYDAKGRLIVKKSTGSVNNNQTQSYCYDKAGNRITYNSNQTGVPASCVTDGTP
jgi:YD repeat-containing protein